MIKFSQGEVCKLKRSLFGLKQASRQWNHKLTGFLISLGYKQSNDYSLFVKAAAEFFTRILVYVYDVLLTGNDSVEIVNIK